MDGYDTPNGLLPEPCDPNWEVELEPEWSYYEQGEQYVQDGQYAATVLILICSVSSAT